ncbi:hypothetical protein CkaCkLH20_02077 [Colletotrichum karsti]|uniref:Uncharacterized protein n=1 Tax=Colletotrichum karsti TaxID=1095194 RepID=A0A9P6LNN5_9PEZI|nr:uncharacterized protein CkaCkLH20_02077 [Colletotrichum karsti]KAF9880123.1 hypothetical protein CkaCkLH20_02077 [Colletotrichum karsti]
MDLDFRADIWVLEDASVPFQQKKEMLDIIFNEIVLYRYHDGLQPILFEQPNLNLFQPNNLQAELDNNIGPTDDLLVAGNSADYSLQLTPKLPIKRERIEMLVSEEEENRIVEQVLKPATFMYHGLIQDMNHFQQVDEAYDFHVRKKAGLTPEEDQTWPTTTAQQKAYVQQLFEQITDMSDFYELRKVTTNLANRRAKTAEKDCVTDTAADQSTSRKRQRTNKAGKSAATNRPADVKKAEWDMINPESSDVDKLAVIVHHRISDLEIEILSWRLLIAAMNAQRGFSLRPLWSGQRTTSTWDSFDTFADRWSAMCDVLLDCKLMIDSLTGADWISKFAGAPLKERAGKLNNDLLNGRRDIQNQVGREMIRIQTHANEWTSSESYEIKSKDGHVIVKGGNISEATRRKLAVRSNQDSGTSTATTTPLS